MTSPPAAESPAAEAVSATPDTAEPCATSSSVQPRQEGARGKATAKHLSVCFDDEFMLYRFKVEPCMVARPHIWKNCPFVHSGEPVKRRHPSQHHPDLCSAAKNGQVCEDGPEHCIWAHNAFEHWLHPSRYKTIMCRKGKACSRNICFFAHSESELRAPSSPTQPPQPSWQLQQQLLQLPSGTTVMLASAPQQEQPLAQLMEAVPGPPAMPGPRVPSPALLPVSLAGPSPLNAAEPPAPVQFSSITLAGLAIEQVQPQPAIGVSLPLPAAEAGGSSLAALEAQQQQQQRQQFQALQIAAMGQQQQQYQQQQQQQQVIAPPAEAQAGPGMAVLGSGAWMPSAGGSPVLLQQPPAVYVQPPMSAASALQSFSSGYQQQQQRQVLMLVPDTAAYAAAPVPQHAAIAFSSSGGIWQGVPQQTGSDAGFDARYVLQQQHQHQQQAHWLQQQQQNLQHRQRQYQQPYQASAHVAPAAAFAPSPARMPHMQPSAVSLGGASSSAFTGQVPWQPQHDQQQQQQQQLQLLQAGQASGSGSGSQFQGSSELLAAALGQLHVQHPQPPATMGL